MKSGIRTKVLWMGMVLTTFVFSLAEAQLIKAPEKEAEKPKVVAPPKKVAQPVAAVKMIYPAYISGKGITQPQYGNFDGVKDIHVHYSGYNLALKEDGSLWSWGQVFLTVMGFPNEFISLIPISIFTQHTWKKVVAGYLHCLGIRSDGSLWGWGSSHDGQLGIGVTTNDSRQLFPMAQIGKDTDWISVYVSFNTSMAIKKDGSLWAWGQNEYGQLGVGSYGQKSIPVPRKVNTDLDWTMVALHDDHAVALKTNGTLWSWGVDDGGEIGIGAEKRYLYQSPKQIGNDSNWIQVAACQDAAYGLKKDGSLWAWGSNYYGQLGTGDTTNRKIPAPVGVDLKWQQIHANNRNVIALDQNSRAWTWGREMSNTPKLVSVEHEFVKVATSGQAYFGIKKDGSVWTWGNMFEAEMGLIENKSPKVPVRIARTLVGY